MWRVPGFDVPAPVQETIAGYDVPLRSYADALFPPVRAVAPAHRGEPSDAQMDAAREAWPADAPLPNDTDLAAIIRAANLAPWPHVRAVSGAPELTVTRLAALLQECPYLLADADISRKKEWYLRAADWLAERVFPALPRLEAPRTEP